MVLVGVPGAGAGAAAPPLPGDAASALPAGAAAAGAVNGGTGGPGVGSVGGAPAAAAAATVDAAAAGGVTMDAAAAAAAAAALMATAGEPGADGGGGGGACAMEVLSEGSWVDCVSFLSEGGGGVASRAVGEFSAALLPAALPPPPEAEGLPVVEELFCFGVPDMRSLMMMLLGPAPISPHDPPPPPSLTPPTHHSLPAQPCCKSQALNPCQTA